MPHILRLAGSERGRYRLRLQRGRNGQQWRALLPLCRRQIQGSNWRCRVQRLWSRDLLAQHWRYIIRHLPYMPHARRLAVGERGRYQLRLQRRRYGQQRRTLLPLCRRQV